MPSPRGNEGAIFGEHLREMRLARSYTQQQLADLCESNHPFISDLERGIKIPSLSMLLRLAEALDCGVAELVDVFDRGRQKRRPLPKR